MKVIVVSLFFIMIAVLIIVYGMKSVYDLMNDLDDKNPNIKKSKDNELQE